MSDDASPDPRVQMASATSLNTYESLVSLAKSQESNTPYQTENKVIPSENRLIINYLKNSDKVLKQLTPQQPKLFSSHWSKAHSKTNASISNPEKN
jgi:hypothetical protein